MYLVEVAPLTRLSNQNPQIFSYFSARELSVGFLVLVALGRRSEKAIVIETHEIKNHKIEIKEAGYELRPIKKILSTGAVLTEKQIKLALWLGQYYFASPGIFMKMMLPKKVTRSVILSSAQRNEGSGANARRKRQKLILVPTMTQIDAIAENYSHNNTSIIHSGLKSKQLNENWQKIASGSAEVIVGTRLAVFAPFSNLKEIIIQDETNSGHRSWDMFPHYRVHEIAQKLAELFDAKLELKSDLLSIESHFVSPSPIFPISQPPPILIDLRAEIREGNFFIFSRQLQQIIRQALENKKQIILFINRRGTATFILCRDCGFVAKCANCESLLTYHISRDVNGLKPILICHHCGQRSNPPTICPKCQGHRIKAFGTGTERVEIEAHKLFGNAKILRLDSDAAQTPNQQQKIIQEFKEKKGDILIGTQMLLNLFANLQLDTAVVAIISADTFMHLPDFHSDEKMFQTIDKLRRRTQSNFIIQTYNPKSETLNLAAKGDFKTFYDREIETRKILNYPPFSQIIKLVFRHKDPQKAGSEAKILSAKLTQMLKTSKILNEAIIDTSEAVPAFIPKEKSKYVWQIIIKAKPYWLAPVNERQELLRLRNKILMIVPPDWEIDIDPETLL